LIGYFKKDTIGFLSDASWKKPVTYTIGEVRNFVIAESTATIISHYSFTESIGRSTIRPVYTE